MSTLTERRKADRANMAEQVWALAVEHGATAEIVEQPFGDMCPRMVMVEIKAARGVCLNVDFDGESCQPDTFVLSWHIRTGGAAFSDAFGRELNRCHFHKATDVVRGFENLLPLLAARLDCIRSGEAFSAEREAANAARWGKRAA